MNNKLSYQKQRRERINYKQKKATKKWIYKDIPSFLCSSISPLSPLFFLLRQQQYTNVPRLVESKMIQIAAIATFMATPVTKHLQTSTNYYLITFVSFVSDFQCLLLDIVHSFYINFLYKLSKLNKRKSYSVAKLQSYYLTF